MDYDLTYDIEDAWQAHPDNAVYQRLNDEGRHEEAQALKRQVLIHLTRTAVRDFMRDQERRLDDYVMNKIDEAIAHTRGFNLPEPTRELFREEYKHQLYLFLIEYSNRNDNRLHRMYSDLGDRIGS
ncbi:hypothetical protein [Marinospirillum perlucidum]|uniref:hypothetical protein n=1 Tax=Marinospirillum perlucidum TaxID=1982602 RepID=UPI000DF16999|nr:hypothetical protein [Marinospirillum perlucidum]